MSTTDLADAVRVVARVPIRPCASRPPDSKLGAVRTSVVSTGRDAESELDNLSADFRVAVRVAFKAVLVAFDGARVLFNELPVAFNGVWIVFAVRRVRMPWGPPDSELDAARPGLAAGACNSTTHRSEGQ